MRTLFCLLFALIGISAAQEMTFRSGPSYLMTSGSPTFAQSIATPTLSIDIPLPPIPSLPEVGPAVIDQPYVVNPELEQAPDVNAWAGIGFLFGTKSELSGTGTRTVASISDQVRQARQCSDQREKRTGRKCP